MTTKMLRELRINPEPNDIIDFHKSAGELLPVAFAFVNHSRKNRVTIVATSRGGTNMAKISACVITKNEADNITRCLQSVRSSVDEIIIVDTGSTDETVTIAEHMGAKIFPYQWQNDFAAARNYALKQALGDWIIFLDADEYIVADKVINLRPLIERLHGNRKIDAITCLMEHTEGFNGSLKGRDRTVRIFRNSHAIRYKGRVHESIYKHGKSANAAYAEESLLCIRHTGYDSAKIINKLHRNHALLEAELNEGDINSYTYHYLSHSYWLQGQYEKAIEFANKALADKLIFKSTLAYRPYLILITSMMQLNSYGSEAIQPVLDEALQKFSHHPEILRCHACYQHKNECYTQALELFLQSLSANECYRDNTLANDFFMDIPQVHSNIAALYDKMNDSAKALKHYVLALKTDKYYKDAFSGLFSLISTQKAADIIYLLNSLYNIRDEADVTFLVLRLAALKGKQVFAFYEKIWSKQFDHQDFTGMVLFLNGNFKPAAQLFIAAFRETGDYQAELLAVIAALLSDNQEWLESLQPQLKSSLHKISTAFFQPDADSRLSAEDFPYYLDIVSNFVHLSNETQMNKLLQLGFTFPLATAPEQIAELLLAQKFYRYALTMYTRQLNQLGSEAVSASTVYRQAGFCCYKLKNYNAAVDLFAKALASGSVTNEIGEYLSWSYQQCQNAAVTYKIETLQVKYGITKAA